MVRCPQDFTALPPTQLEAPQKPPLGGCGEALKEGLESRTGVVAEATVRVFLCARPVYMICRLDFI